MASHLRHLLLLLNFLHLISSSSTGFAKETTNAPPINVTKHINFPNDDIKLLGSARISGGKTIQIPDPFSQSGLQHLAGRALYPSPIRVLDPNTQTAASFTTTFSFQFTKSSSSDSDRGSGLSFIIVPDEFTVGRPGPWLGMMNDACEENYKAVAIEFDAHQNTEFGDPNDNHIGINLGSIVSTTIINASDFGVYFKDGSIHKALIVYDGTGRYLDIHLGSNDQDLFSSKSIFSGPLDIAPFLNEYMFVGFSASTGNFSQIHNIISWNFSSVSAAFLKFPSSETCEEKIISEDAKDKKNIFREPQSSVFIFVAVVVLSFAVLLNIYCIWSHKRKKDQNHVVLFPEGKQRPRPPNKPRRFTISEISSATRCFSESEILDNDSRGVLYRGTLLNGCHVAVKRFSTQFLHSLSLEKRRLKKEVRCICGVRHPNLVPIRGWCYDHGETMVIYDYLPNGSLEKWLFGVGALPWSRRFKVIKDISEGLGYLHSKQVSHKNINTKSVFLDISFRAVLGDYGFVLLGSETKRFEAMVGTKLDVFDFGVLVLEIVSGRRRSECGEMDLLDLAWKMHETGEKERVVDRRMGSVVNLEQAVRVMDIGLLCTLNESKGRPSMDEVVGFLNSDIPIPELPLTRPVSLFPYSSATSLCVGYTCTPFQ
ncbi:Legume lectin domain [Dillenia turbinata]|uniref:Legume lectin domain n=1 Tax=Dillenia turbinata TaxID=194707 RepID=A0AAN8VEP0_9MAGN